MVWFYGILRIIAWLTRFPNYQVTQAYMSRSVATWTLMTDFFFNTPILNICLASSIQQTHTNASELCTNPMISPTITRGCTSNKFSALVGEHQHLQDQDGATLRQFLLVNDLMSMAACH